MSNLKLKEPVKIVCSDETGIIIGKAQYLNGQD